MFEIYFEEKISKHNIEKLIQLRLYFNKIKKLINYN